MLLSLFCSGALSGSLFFWLCLSPQTWVEEQIYSLLGPCNACCFIATLCPTLYHPVNCSPPGSSVHGISPGKNTGVGCWFFLQGIFPAQGSNCICIGTQILYHWATWEVCKTLESPRTQGWDHLLKSFPNPVGTWSSASGPKEKQTVIRTGWPVQIAHLLSPYMI